MQGNEEIVKEIQDGSRDRKEAFLLLWKQNTPVIRQTVRKYCRREEYEDGLQEAFISLVNAAEHYRHDNGAGFLAYLCACIRQQLTRTLICSASVSIPEKVQRAAARYESIENDFYTVNGRFLSDLEMAELLDVPVIQIGNIRTAAIALNPESLEKPLPETEGLTLSDTLEDSKAEFESGILSDGSAAALLNAAQEELTEQEFNILIARAEGKTFTEIGKEAGKTPGQARSDFQKAARTLVNSDRFRKVLPDSGYYRGSLASFLRTWTSCTEWEAIGY